jgi:hypothetical protein
MQGLLLRRPARFALESTASTVTVNDHQLTFRPIHIEHTNTFALQGGILQYNPLPSSVSSPSIVRFETNRLPRATQGVNGVISSSQLHKRWGVASPRGVALFA